MLKSCLVSCKFKICFCKIASLQHNIAAAHLIDRGAYRLGEVEIVEGRGVGPCLYCGVMHLHTTLPRKLCRMEPTHTWTWALPCSIGPLKKAVPPLSACHKERANVQRQHTVFKLSTLKHRLQRSTLKHMLIMAALHYAAACVCRLPL